MSGPYMGAILAAGRGTRMAPFGETIPKAALPIGNRALIEYQIEQMRDLGITEIAILIGHRGYQLTKILGDGDKLGVTLHYVEQTEMAGIAHALGRLEQTLTRPFLLMLGDIFFLPRDLTDMMRIFRDDGCKAVLATKVEDDPAAIRKNFAILHDEGGRVYRVIEKPRHAQNKLKGVGLYMFDPVIFDAVRRTPRTAMRNEFEITDSIQIMIDDGHHVRVSDCIEDDINLTFPSDLLRCNLIVAERQGLRNIIDPTAQLHPDVMLDGAIIGKNVAINRGISVRRSVFLEGAMVSSDRNIDGFVISPTQMVDCRADLGMMPLGMDA